MTTATAATTTAAATAEIAFATLAIAPALRVTAGLTFRTRAAVFTLEPARLAAAAATAAMTVALAVFAVATRLAAGRTGGRWRRFIAAEQAFEPAEDAAGFLRRLGLRAPVLNRLVARLETTVIPTGWFSLDYCMIWEKYFVSSANLNGPS